MKLPKYIQNAINMTLEGTLKMPRRFKLTMGDVKKIANGKHKLLVIEPQSWNSVILLNDKNMMFENREDDDKDSVGYFHRFSGFASSGSGSDPWYKYSNDLQEWARSIHKKSSSKKSNKKKSDRKKSSGRKPTRKKSDRKKSKSKKSSGRKPNRKKSDRKKSKSKKSNLKELKLYQAVYLKRTPRERKVGVILGGNNKNGYRVTVPSLKRTLLRQERANLTPTEKKFKNLIPAIKSAKKSEAKEPVRGIGPSVVRCPYCNHYNPNEFPLETYPPSRRCLNCKRVFAKKSAKAKQSLECKGERCVYVKAKEPKAKEPVRDRGPSVVRCPFCHHYNPNDFPLDTYPPQRRCLNCKRLFTKPR
jgi:hypothetical protein